ncbi:hypothetical protein VNO77_30726 [Canavalia gladiata]|uniref:Uncharacterized protein n=1 Tax=Canavalia gladiata TaxID=3824 RepID=A0AAN9Q3D8_CANGL
MQGFNRILMHLLTYPGCLCFIHLQLRSWSLLKSPPLDEAPPRYFIVWMLLVPEKFQAFFRGSSEQYGFLIKVTPPSIMGGERNLSLNDSVCPLLLLFPLLPFLFFLSPYPVPDALLGVAILEVPHLRSLRLLLQEPEPKKGSPLFSLPFLFPDFC